MVEVERTFTVMKPLTEVVEYLKDFSRAETWDPGTVSCERIGDGPIDVGTRWHNVSKFLGRETELTYELRRLEVDRLTFVGTNKTATSTDDITFTTNAEGTSITYHATIEFHGAAKVAGPFVKGEFEKLGDSTVESMTKAIESIA